MKKLLALSAVLAAMSFTSAHAQQTVPVPETEFTIKLKASQLNVVGAGLQELPAKFANPVWVVIQNQVNEQSKAPEAKPAEEPAK